MPGRRQCLVMTLVLAAVVSLTGCGLIGGGDDDSSETAFCQSRSDLGKAVADLRDFQLAAAEDVPEAKQKIALVLSRLRDMLEAAPADISAAADTMASGLDDIEAQVQDADALELGTQVPALLARIGGAGQGDTSAAVAEVNAYAAQACA